MAVHLATAADYLQRTTSLLLSNANSTVCFWVKLPTVAVTPLYQVPYIILDNPSVYATWAAVYADTGGTNLQVNGTNSGGAALTANTYYYLSWVQSGTTQRFYVNGILIGSYVKDRSADTVGFELIGQDTFSEGDITIGFCREWQAALNISEIRAEMVSTTVVRTANLFLDTPLVTDLLDISGHGRDWTQVGSGSFVAGPNPSNSSAATATVLTIPYTASVTLTPPFTTWYSYTPSTSSVIGVFGYSADIAPQIEVFSPDSVTNYLAFNTGSINTNVPIQVSTFVGSTYYFRFTPTVYPTTADLSISALAAPTSTVSRGDFVINDDTVGYPLAFLSGNGSTVLKFQQNMPTGEGGDVLSDSGVMLFEDFPTGTLRLYDATLTTELTSITFGPGTGGTRVLVRANQTSQTFYAGQENFNAHPQFHRITAAGVDSALTTTSANGMRAFAVNDDETILYLAGSTTSTSSNIKQWDIVGNAFLADLVAAVANYRVTDMLWLEDQTLLVMYVKTFSPGDVRVVRYSTAGATLNTYTLASAVQLPSVSSGYRLAFALDSPTSFWAWFHVSDGGAFLQGISRFQNVLVADGTILTSIDYYEYEFGVYNASPAVSPGARFGPSSSCPFMLLRIAPDVAVSVREYLIRRERWFPVVSQEQHRLFFHKLQLYFESGTGINDGQGSDPLVELDWSDDGGHTWSNLHLLESGPMGQYKRRIIQRMMGQSRERIYRVAVSDPVQWSLIDSFFDLTEGTS